MVNVRINPRLLPVKAHYFTFFGGTAPILPFIPVIGRQLGISEVGIGVIYGIIPIFGLTSKAVLGSIADKFQLHKIIFIIGLLITTVTLFSIQYIPNVTKPSAYLFNSNGNISMHFCDVSDGCAKNIQTNVTDSFIYFTCNETLRKSQEYNEILSNKSNSFLLPPLNAPECVTYAGNLQFSESSYNELDTEFNYTVTSHLLKSECISIRAEECQTWSEVPPFYQLSTFWILFSVLSLNWAGMAIVISIGDALCFHLLEDRPSDYGIQRLWGTLGWGLFSVISGYLIDTVSEDSYHKDYSPAFYLVVGMLFLDIVISSRMKVFKFGRTNNLFKDVCHLFCHLRICVFFVVVLLVGFYTGVLWQFLFWYVEDLARYWGLKENLKLLQGIMLGIQCFGGELPFFFVSGWIIKYLGHRTSLTIVLLSFGIRFILYSQIVNPWLMLPVELFQGITFGLFYATMASYANLIAPLGTAATVQGLVGAIFEGIGVASGSVVGGVLFKYNSGATIFFWLGIISVIAGFCHILAQYSMNKYDSKPRGCASNVDYNLTDGALDLPQGNGNAKQNIDPIEAISF